MPLAAATSTIGLTTPVTAANRPWILWVGGVDMIAYANKDSFQIDDPDGTQPARFRVTLDDKLNAFGTALTTQTLVEWYDSVNDTYLFRGPIKIIRPIQHGPYASWELECSDVSELLDYAVVPLAVRPLETSQARLEYLVGLFAHADMASGGFIQNIVTLNPMTFSKETLRSAIERTLAACGSNAEYHVDLFGQLHVYSGSDGSVAPKNITDAFSFLLAYAANQPEYDGLADVDGVQVYGATAAGSGLFWGPNPPRNPPRIVGVDAPNCYDAVTAANVAQGELSQRTLLTRATVVVEGVDGWAKGQTVSITNSVLGWAGRQFVIKGVTMRVLSGAGLRRYELACGSPQGRMSRDLAAAIANAEGATQGSSVVGTLAGNQSAGPVNTGFAAVQLVSTGIDVTDPTGAVRVYIGNIPGGDWGLQVVGPGGVVIVDGSSDVFKIAAFGTLNVTAPARAGANYGTASTAVTLTGLGGLPAIPAFLAFVSADGSSALFGRAQATYMMAYGGAALWAASSSGGATTGAFMPWEASGTITVVLNGSNQAVVTIFGNNSDSSTHTFYGTYYVLQEAAM